MDCFATLAMTPSLRGAEGGAAIHVRCVCRWTDCLATLATTILSQHAGHRALALVLSGEHLDLAALLPDVETGLRGARQTERVIDHAPCLVLLVPFDLAIAGEAQGR